MPKTLEIEYTDIYENAGCRITGNVGVVKYYHLCKHGFNSAYQADGLYDWIDKAKELVAEKHPIHEIQLVMPDVVFTY